MLNKKLSVTVVLLAYNQELFIDEAVQSLLQQDYPNIEYIFSDDFSTDSTFDKICKICADSERNVRINRNSENMGLSEHVNKCLRMATGDIIVLAAGDDVSLPNRVSKTVEYFVEHDDLHVLSFNDIKIINGIQSSEKICDIEMDLFVDLDKYLKGTFTTFSGASRAFRRELVEYFGDLNPQCPTEDTTYLFRGLLLGKALMSHRPGIFYRIHDLNLSSADNMKLMNIESIKQQYLKDLQLAADRLPLMKDKVKKIEEWIDSNYKIRKINRRSGFIKYCLYFSLFLTSFSFRGYVFRRIFK